MPRLGRHDKKNGRWETGIRHLRQQGHTSAVRPHLEPCKAEATLRNSAAEEERKFNVTFLSYISSTTLFLPPCPPAAMLEFPTTPNRHKVLRDAHDESPASSIKNSPSSASLKSKRTASLHSPGKLVKKVKNTLRRLGDHVTHHGHKQRTPSESGLPLTTNPLLEARAPIVSTASHDDATTPLAQQQPQNGLKRSRHDSGTPWEEKRDAKHVARRSRSLSFISGFFPRTRTSSRAESVSTTTVEHSVSDSGTLASEGLAQGLQDAQEKEYSVVAQVEPAVALDPPQYQLVIVEERTPEEDQGSEEEQMNRDQSGLGELPSPVAEEEVGDSSPSDLTPSQEVITEPEVPDPFLIDEEGDALSEEERDAEKKALEENLSESQEHSTPAHEISLLPQEAPTVQPLPSPAVDKDVPPLPPAESEKEEAPELYVPALIVPSMFLPIPNVRRFFIYNQLTWYLSRSIMYYMYARRTL